MVFANLWASTHGESQFTAAELFNPERFLDDEGNFAKPESKLFMPFGIGKAMEFL